MAPRPAETHRAGQEALASLVVPLVGAAFATVDVDNLKETLPRFKVLLAALIARYGQAAAMAGLDFFRRSRTEAGVPGPFPSTRLPGPVAQGHVDAVVDYATRDLWGPNPNAPLPQGGFVPDPGLALQRLQVAAERLVLDQSRDAVIGAVRQDGHAKGWARIPKEGACFWCLMLASRGAVYKTKVTAGFEPHDRCHCTPEPFWGSSYEMTARAQAARELWDESTKGRSGKDARVAFRQAVEGRPVTGTKGARPKRVGIIASSMTADEIRHQITVLQGATPSDYRTRRLRELRAALTK